MLSVVVVSYNTKDFIAACIDSIKSAARNVDSEIIVVDNASEDGTWELVSKTHSDVKLVRTKSNIGFGPGCNIGARTASGEFILLVNPDAVIAEEAIDELLNLASEFPSAGIWGGRAVNPDGSLNAGSCWRFPNVWSTFCIVSGLAKAFRNSDFFNSEAYGGWRRDTVREVDVVSGCLFLIRRQLWDALDGFDPVYFLYSEEVDLCLRARALGARPVITPKAEIMHHVGGSESVQSRRIVLLFKGKITYMRLHWPPLQRRAGTVLLLSWALSRFLSLGARDRLSGGGSASEAAQTWQQVWHSRRAWLKGYEATPVDE